MTHGLTYPELKALFPCEESFSRITKLLGGPRKWNGRKISAVEARAAGQAVGEGHAVEEHGARHGAEQEVLEGRLGGARVVTPDAGEHVDGEREDLQRHEHDQEVVGHGHHDHPGDPEEHEGVVLARRHRVPTDHLRGEEDREDADREENIRRIGEVK